MFKHQAQTKQPAKEKSEKSFALKEFDSHLLTAAYFGFTPIQSPEITKEDIAKQKTIKDPLADHPRTKLEWPFNHDVIEKAAILRTYVDWKWDALPPPVLVAFKKPLPGSEHKKSSTETTLGLEILGLTNSSAEAILIRTALSILDDEGFKDLTIHINSLGDKESVSDFERMIGTYVRKNVNNMTADLRKAIKKDIFEIVRSPELKADKVPGETPKSLSFLSENSRNHFKEVIEYIESFDIPFVITPTLIGSPTFCSHTLFEIRTDEGKTLLANGYRYSRLAKKIGFKREIPAIGATISFKKKEKSVVVKGVPKMKFYLVQLGFGAKMKTLKALEILRKSKIFVAHSLAKDKLQSQLTSAENMKTPYMLLIGQKEASEECVVVRDADTRVQESIPLCDLVAYLKKLK